MKCRKRIVSIKKILAFAVVAATLAMPAGANDSIAGLGVGGLTLLRTAEISMAAETLTIRPDRVTIQYRFLNRTARDIEAIVAFPLPDVPAEYRESDGIGVQPDPVNFVGFTVAVDGRPVRPQGELRAFVGQREVTALLRRHNVPLSHFDANLPRALAQLPGPARRELTGVVSFPSSGEPEPQWTMRTRYFWTQRFPAGREVAVEHSYRPAAGAVLITREDWASTLRQNDLCIDAAGSAQWEPVIARAEYGTVSFVDYILTTARNWHGPIGAFRLIVEDSNPNGVAHGCFDGLRRVSATRVEATLADFVPQRELRVGFLRPRDPDPPASSNVAGRWPETSQRRLNDVELANLSRADLQLMRNEIFARHGLIFRTDAMRGHFTRQPWYRPTRDNVDALLTPIERANVGLIRARERAAN